jgi:ubiquinone/menaquinone biosynthesis C-methylase UbiE
MNDVAAIYRHRFSERDLAAKDAIWKVLCEAFFQRFVPSGGTVLDLACGYGDFSRHIRAARRIAVDENIEAARHLPAEVAFHRAAAHDMDFLAPASIDVCFVSNFFEHLPDKAAMDAVLAEVRRVLKPGGLLIALQPNIRLIGGAYWDFYDHQLPLTDVSCAEGFVKNGFTVETVIPRFLPYTTKSRLPRAPAFVRLYLRVPLAWRVLGKQFLIVGRRPR